MQTISVLTTQNVAIQYPIASLGDRIASHLVDLIIKVVYILLMVALFVNIELEIVWIYLAFLGLPWLLYHVAFEIFMNGQSPGKRMMNIQVVRLDGTQPTIGDYVLRWVFSLVDFYMLSGAIAVIFIAFSDRGQRLGDMVAGTTVVKLTAQREFTASEIFITPENNYIPSFPQVTQLESRDIELIQRALEANTQFENAQPALLVADKIKALLGIQTDMSPIEFLYTIVRDYNQINSR